jgi:hypothetical protein
MRVRVFQGNISIGDEYALEELFSERRFATWHIGGIHVSPALRPNARRDGFEETAAYEKFLDQLDEPPVGAAFTILAHPQATQFSLVLAPVIGL